MNKTRLQDTRLGLIGMHGRVFAYLLLFTVVLLALLWLFQVAYLDDFYEYVKTEQLSSTAANAVSALESENPNTVLIELAQKRQTCISVYRVGTPSFFELDSEEIIHVDVLADCVIHHIGRTSVANYYREAAAEGNSYTERVDRSQFAPVAPGKEDDRFWDRLTAPRENALSDSLIYARIQQNAAGETYFFLLNSSITPVTATVTTLRIQLILISCIMLLLALALSTVIANTLSRPITAITRDARRLAAGDFSVDFEGKGYQEVDELAAALNFAAQELERSDRVQQEIVANLSHDLRTPLTMIGGYAEFMRDFPATDHSESIAVIIEETQRLADLVNDVLDNSRLSAGVEELQKTRFDFAESLTDFIRRYSALIEKDGYHILLTAPAHLFILADEQRLLQAVSNLLNNALTHCGEDKNIYVNLARKEGSMQLSITDNGQGIAKEDLPFIWKRYYHADAPERGHKSSGLGLAIVKGVLELHGAKYGVESTPGKGSKFWFSLPLEKERLNRT